MADRNDMLFRDLSEAEFVFECELHVRDPSCRRPYPATQLRKQRKYHRVLKKRQVDLTKQEESRTLNEIVQGIMSDNPEQQLSSTFAARIILSRETNPPIDDLVQAGIVSQLVNFLLREEMPELQFEACGALTNITSGDSEQTRTVVRALLDQALDAIESLLSSSDAKVAEKAVLFLGNIAGDGPTFQREFSKFRFFSSVLQPLLNLINTTSPISLLRNIAFTLSNLCSYKDPLPLVSQIEQYLHGLKYLITSNDKEVLGNV
ncbi:importin subunit alpha-5-like isoform X2 [Artemia franciscana]